MQNLNIALKNLEVFPFTPAESFPQLPASVHLFVWCKRGSFLYFSNGKPYVVRENQLAFFPCSHVRFVHAFTEAPISVVAFPMQIRCHDTDLFDFFDATSDALVIDMAAKTLQEIYKGILSASSIPSENLRHLAASAYATQLCSLYMKARVEAEVHDDPFSEVRSFMENHLSEDLSLDDLSAHMHYNSVYFSQKFKDKIGISPIKYLVLLRIKNAARLLLTSSLSISEIGHMSGFQSIYYFRTFFGKYTGLSPDDFRQKYR